MIDWPNNNLHNNAPLARVIVNGFDYELVGRVCSMNVYARVPSPWYVHGHDYPPPAHDHYAKPAFATPSPLHSPFTDAHSKGGMHFARFEANRDKDDCIVKLIKEQKLDGEYGAVVAE